MKRKSDSSVWASQLPNKGSCGWNADYPEETITKANAINCNYTIYAVSLQTQPEPREQGCLLSPITYRKDKDIYEWAAAACARCPGRSIYMYIHNSYWTWITSTHLLCFRIHKLQHRLGFKTDPNRCHFFMERMKIQTQLTRAYIWVHAPFHNVLLTTVQWILDWLCYSVWL